MKQQPTDFYVERIRRLLSVGCRYQQTLDLRVIPGFRRCVMRSLLFWDVTQRTLVVSHRRFGSTHPSELGGSSSPRRIPIPNSAEFNTTGCHWNMHLQAAVTSDMGTVGCTETPVTKYQYCTMRYNPEQQISQHWDTLDWSLLFHVEQSLNRIHFNSQYIMKM
jgi:hypothetical protein